MKTGKRRLMTKFEKELWFKFKIPGGHNLQRKKLNQPSLSAANTWEHEELKLKDAYDALKNNELFIMEAEEIKTKRIRDFVNLTRGMIKEYERDKRRYDIKNNGGAYKSPNCIVEVVKVWETGGDSDGHE